MASAALKGASSLTKLTPWIKRSLRFNKDSAKWQVALSKFTLNQAGYRQLGLRYDSDSFLVRIVRIVLTFWPRWDDLIPEESDVVQLAIKRLPPQTAYDRIFRLRRAFQVNSSNIQPHKTSIDSFTSYL
jgi:Ubiquinol-cytochrome C reductase complex 14kD subunit